MKVNNARTKRVLVVDDNPDMRESLKALLERAGYAVSLARHGDEALEVQRRTPAEVLLTDLFMPDREGIETIASFRNRYPEIAIIAMSGEATIRISTDYLKVARAAGADATLRKPFPAAALLAEVERVSPAGTAG